MLYCKHMFKAKKFLFAFMFLTSLLQGACATPDAQPSGPKFTVTIKNETDQITYEDREGATFIDVQSPTGIGTARFDLESGEMPEKIVIALHLAGLEEFRITFGETVVAVSFSSSGVLTDNQQRIITPQKEDPISPIHPYWLNIHVVSNQAAPTIPLEQGYFEVEIPKGLLSESGSSFEIQWIDFYR